MTNDVVQVHAGQVYADMDPRQVGRTVQVERVEGPTAYVVCLTDATELDGRRSSVGRHSMIAIERLQRFSGRKGYRLVPKRVEARARKRRPAPLL